MTTKRVISKSQEMSAAGIFIAAFPNEDAGVPQAGTWTDEEGRFRLPLVRGDSRDLGRVTLGVR